MRDREPVVAGRFYEGDKQDLEEQVRSFLMQGEACSDEVSALIVPHAGYVYSGPVAGKGYSLLNPDKRYQKIFLIGSSHRMAFEGASIYNVGNYLTPLGTVPVDMETANELIGASMHFSFQPGAHNQEHSLEVQLPFLQVQLKEPFSIIPIVIGTRDPQVCKHMAKALKPYFTKDNLFIISSDFSHYPDYDTATDIDARTAKAIMSNDPAQLIKALEQCDRMTSEQVLTGLCGWTSVLTLMYMTRDDRQIRYEHIAYQNSGDATFGDKDKVVGYQAIAIRREEEFAISAIQKELLLKLAHEELAILLKKGGVDRMDEALLNKELGISAGAFVSLYNEKQLRGCIGNFQTGEPLWKVVKEMTRAAASRDTRFEPVSADELEDINIEISVLSPLKKVNDVSEIDLGRHGIYMKKDGRTGTFLPQVATKTDWNLEEFLGHCARDKAHIGWDGWKEADLFTYEAFVFSDDKK